MHLKLAKHLLLIVFSLQNLSIISFSDLKPIIKLHVQTWMYSSNRST